LNEAGGTGDGRAMSDPLRGPRWIQRTIDVGAGFFLVALIVSAVFDPSIRVLHALQALIYVAVIVLTRRRSAWGYGAGCVIALVWNAVNLAITGFIAAGFTVIAMLIRTGQLVHAEYLIAVIAALGHAAMIVACAVGFVRLRPTWRGWARFAAGGVVAVLYFAAIIVTTGPQYVHLIKRVLGLA
jgi:hypothetical protein